ncbi:MAG: 3-methyl-2-oxobutanoate hydroxymethyltransferase [SAR202 cluster bacterium]|nr:3-methyl-2-oxobutanoate hydroxymethyltransferase [SAR202 cluster bacterium]
MRLNINNISEMYKNGEKISAITAYDFTFASLADSVGFPIILVGDSLGQVALGYDSTVPVTMSDMLIHVKSVVRGAKRSLIIADMPFMSYQSDISDAISNAGRLIKEGGAQSVKLEGGAKIANTVAKVVDCGIPVMGHIGLTPQSVNQLGGYKVQGKSEKEKEKLIADAKAIENAGAYSIVLELIKSDLAEEITKEISIPTIGIGSGPNCSGQIQVIHDVLGLSLGESYKHSRQYLDLRKSVPEALKQYLKDSNSGDFPSSKESF